MPRALAAIVRELFPVVAETTHFVDCLRSRPVLVLDPDKAGDNSRAIMSGGAMEHNAAGLRRGENFPGDWLD